MYFHGNKADHNEGMEINQPKLPVGQIQIIQDGA